jgi:hypothetical protein
LTLALALTAILAVGGVYACYTSMIGRVKMPWQVVAPPPNAVMTPSRVIVPIGTMVEGGTVSSSPMYSKANLTVTTATQLNVSLGGDYSGLTVLNVTVNLVNMTSAVTVYTVTVTIGVPSATIPSVAVGTYGMYIGFNATAGYSESCGEANLTFS